MSQHETLWLNLCDKSHRLGIIQSGLWISHPVSELRTVVTSTVYFLQTESRFRSCVPCARNQSERDIEPGTPLLFHSTTSPHPAIGKDVTQCCTERAASRKSKLFRTFWVLLFVVVVGSPVRMYLYLHSSDLSGG